MPLGVLLALAVMPRDGLTYVSIPAGVYDMGCSAGDSECFAWEPPRHKVTIARGFRIGQRWSHGRHIYA
jgi:formylglycine-generating enzyme required for sulfatase activity